MPVSNIRLRYNALMRGSGHFGTSRIAFSMYYNVDIDILSQDVRNVFKKQV